MAPWTRSTLLFDLLSTEDESDSGAVFDVELLAARLDSATRWLRESLGDHRIPVGFFGASTGAAAALWAASDPALDIRAVVARGGRPDLAIARLASVTAPTLLVVGGRDHEVITLNEEARGHLRVPCDLRVVPGATHLFEEPGALETVSDLAAEWFRDHF